MIMFIHLLYHFDYSVDFKRQSGVAVTNFIAVCACEIYQTTENLI